MWPSTFGMFGATCELIAPGEWRGIVPIEGGPEVVLRVMAREIFRDVFLVTWRVSVTWGGLWTISGLGGSPREARDSIREQVAELSRRRAA